MYVTQLNDDQTTSHFWLVNPSMLELKGFARAGVRERTWYGRRMAWIVVWAFLLLGALCASGGSPLAVAAFFLAGLATLVGILYVGRWRLSHFREMERQGRVINLDTGAGAAFRTEVLFPDGSERELPERYQWQMFETNKMPRGPINKFFFGDFTNRKLLERLSLTQAGSVGARKLLTDQLRDRANLIFADTLFRGELGRHRRSAEAAAQAQAELTAKDIATAGGYDLMAVLMLFGDLGIPILYTQGDQGDVDATR